MDWTTTKIKAEFSYGLIFSEMFNLEKLKYRLNESCEGIPPYPEDDAVIIDNMFESNALGVERVLKNGVTKETPAAAGVSIHIRKSDGMAGPDPA